MVGILLLLIGTGALAAGWKALSTSLRARRWPVVPARIVERGVGPATTAGSSRPGRYFEPRVTYAYTVEGKSYTGDRIGLSKNAYDRDSAERVARALPEIVEVRYNPGDPGDAFLQPSALAAGVVIVVAGILGVLIGAGLIVSTFGARAP